MIARSRDKDDPQSKLDFYSSAKILCSLFFSTVDGIILEDEQYPKMCITMQQIRTDNKGCCIFRLFEFVLFCRVKHGQQGKGPIKTSFSTSPT